MKKTHWSAFLLLIIAAGLMLVLVHALKPASLTTYLVFSAWLILPDLLMAIALVQLLKKQTSSCIWPALVMVVAASGLLLLADIVFWHPDAQGALGVLMVPLLQYGGMALLIPVGVWMSKRSSYSD